MQKPTDIWLPPPPFSTDQKFFLNYYRRSTILFSVLAGIILYLRWQQIFVPSEIFSISSTLAHFAILVIGIYLGVLSGIFIHNATHFQFRPKFLNYWVGELAGLQQLYGFPGWQFSHYIHHRYPDNPTLDPHFPGNRSFLSFSFLTTFLTFKSLNFFYFRTWGVSNQTKTIWRKGTYYWYSSFFLRLIFIYFFLGPKLFIILFLPSYFAMVLFTGVVNFFGHRPDKNGVFEIKNLDTGIYRLFDILTFGVFWHKEHHLKPHFFNPAKSVRIDSQS